MCLYLSPVPKKAMPSRLSVSNTGTKRMLEMEGRTLCLFFIWGVRTEADLDDSEADAFEEIHQKYTTQDPQLEAFLVRCGAPHLKGHVVRYALGGRPLWPFSSSQLRLEDVPNCACGARRQFEFQVWIVY